TPSESAAARDRAPALVRSSRSSRSGPALRAGSSERLRPIWRLGQMLRSIEACADGLGRLSSCVKVAPRPGRRSSIHAEDSRVRGRQAYELHGPLVPWLFPPEVDGEGKDSPMPVALNVVYLAILWLFSPFLVFRAFRSGKYRDGWAE